MAILKLELKQHTPIIHFQHYQEGATLRASELKPKLDKFLIEKLKLTAVDDRGRIVPKREYLKWFNNKEKLSLDYKVKIIDNDLKPRQRKVEIMPSTFENWILSIAYVCVPSLVRYRPTLSLFRSPNILYMA